MGSPVCNIVLRSGCDSHYRTIPHAISYASRYRSISPLALSRVRLPIRTSMLGPNNNYNAFLRRNCLFDWGVFGTADSVEFSVGKVNSILGQSYCRTRLSYDRNFVAHSGQTRTRIDAPVSTEWLGGIAVVALLV